jgi:hypothetical protein
METLAGTVKETAASRACSSPVSQQVLGGNSLYAKLPECGKTSEPVFQKRHKKSLRAALQQSLPDGMK